MSKVKLISANCPNCGGALKIESGSETALCKYCGSTVLIDDAIREASPAEKPVKVTLDFRRFYRYFGGFGCLVALIVLIAFIVMIVFLGFLGISSGLLAHILGKFGI